MSEHKGNDWYLEPVYPWKENTPYNIHGTTSRIAGIRPFATYLTREEAGPLMAGKKLLEALRDLLSWAEDEGDYPPCKCGVCLWCHAAAAIRAVEGGE